MKKTTYLKITFAILLSFTIVKLYSQEIFIADSPRIRSDFNRYIVFKVNQFIGKSGIFFANVFNKKQPNIEEVLKDVPLRNISKGVYAKDVKNIAYTLIKENEVEWMEYTFEIKGKQMTIKVPKGENPPSQELLEKLY